MNIATIASRYFFTVAELEKMTDSAIGQLHTEALDSRAPDRYAKWHEALFFTSDPIYRQNRIREERGLPALDNKSEKPPVSASEPERTTYPAFAPQPTIRSGMTREDAKAITGGVKAHLQKRYLRRDAINELFNSLNVRVRGLEEELRTIKAENARRFAENDQRHSQAARHRRNLESRLRGEPVERSVHIASAEETRP
jgi:hypothetical protein